MRPAKCASWVLDINALPLVPDQQVLIGRERLNPLSEVPNKVFRSTSRGLAGDCLHETEHAGRLASWGYVVISINANRGITAGAGVADDAGLNLARGRLVLKHLQTLSEWNTVGGTPASLGVDLLHRLDLHHVGLMGHSRGGEGMRAAYNLYRDAGSPWPARIRGGLKIDGIFEFAPADGQTSRTLNADGTTWNVLLPECDGDVSDLEGVKPFDRMLFIAGESPAAWKSTFTVWGANHNFYNTEWQQTDSSGCQLHSPIFNITATGSPEQRQSGLFGLLAFVRGNIGMFANEAFSRNFNPQFALPPVITSVTRTDRGYSDSPRLVRVIDDFDRPTGQSSNGVPTDVNRVSVTNGTISEHDPVQRSGAITWPAGGGSGAPFFETDLIVPGKGVNIRAYKTLNLRLDNQNNATSPTSFRVALAAANGALSTPVWINKYVDLRGPVGGPGGIHRMLQTARIPLRDFRHIRLKAVRGVRLIFNGTPSGAIYAANIRLSKINGVEFKHATHEEAENVEINEITRPSLRVSEQSEKEALVSNRDTSVKHNRRIVRSARSGDRAD